MHSINSGIDFFLQLTGRLLALVREPITYLPSMGRGEPGEDWRRDPTPRGTAGWFMGAACVPLSQHNIPQNPMAALLRRVLDIWVCQEFYLKHCKSWWTT